jgi:hypothetical protein
MSNIKSVKKILRSDLDDGTLACYEVKYNNTIQLTYVPPHPDNTDYQEILQWVAEGNTIEEAD